MPSFRLLGSIIKKKSIDVLKPTLIINDIQTESLKVLPYMKENSSKMYQIYFSFSKYALFS